MGTTEENSFAEAFATALRARGLSLTTLRRRLIDSGNPVAAATLSYWRSGERVPVGAASLAAVEEMERILGLPNGVLLRLITTRTRVGAVTSATDPFTDERVQAAVTETMHVLDAPPRDLTRALSSSTVYDVGADGYVHRQTNIALTQSVVPQTVDHITHVTLSDGAPLDAQQTTVRGARIVRSHLHSSRLVWAAVMRLDHPLSPGSTTMLETTFHPEPDRSAPQPEVGEYSLRPLRELVLWTRLHPDAILDWIDEIEALDDRDDKVVRPLRPQASVHQSRRNFGPGALGIHWGYDGRWDRPSYR